MMDPDKELELLEQEFPKSLRALIKDTPIELDERILSLAHRHSPYLEAQHQLRTERKKLNPSFAKGGRIPPVVRSPISSLPGLQQNSMASLDESFAEPRFERSSMSEPMSPARPPPPSAEKILRMLQKRPQQVWLDRIAGIVKLGDVQLALHLLKKYQDRFGE